MRMLVSSSDRIQMDQLTEMMMRAGLDCNLRVEPQTGEDVSFGFYPELWLGDDDYRTGAVLLASYKPKSAPTSAAAV